MTREQTELVSAAGRAWAETKADALRGELPANTWPDAWNPAWSGALPFRSGEVDDRERPALFAVAVHAAAERWRELVSAQRSAEDVEDEEHDDEARAFRLLSALQPSLPEGLRADHDGPRVYLTDDEGVERTVESLDHAWRVVSEYEERRTLRTS